MATKNRYDDLNTGAIAFATVVSCIVLVLTILSVRALTTAWVESEEERKMAQASYTAADDEISEQRARLVGYGVREVEVAAPTSGDGDEESTESTMEKRIKIPLDQAKDLLMDELGAAADPSA